MLAFAAAVFLLIAPIVINAKPVWQPAFLSINLVLAAVNVERGKNMLTYKFKS